MIRQPDFTLQPAGTKEEHCVRHKPAHLQRCSQKASSSTRTVVPPNPASRISDAIPAPVHTQGSHVHCITILDDMTTGKTGAEFTMAYDKLVIATGAEASTFGTKGLTEYVIFLRDVKNARDIRTKLLLNLMLCKIPGTTAEEKQRLSRIVVVGGGPTGVEFSPAYITIYVQVLIMDEVTVMRLHPKPEKSESC